MAAMKNPRQTPSSNPPDRWNLSDLVNEPVRKLEQHLASLEADVAQIEAARETLRPDMTSSDFQSIVKVSERVTGNVSRLGAYAYLWFSENTKDAKARAFKAQVEERLTVLQNRLLFFDLWWQKVDEQHAARLMADAGDVRYHLETIRRYQPHTLSEPEEKVINVKNVT
ncbi:MAG: putative Oligoendopeptidase, partial [Nitrospira sp.]|nr:putative Oligoendopeptidase [Nitrospira sp.]